MPRFRVLANGLAVAILVTGQLAAGQSLQDQIKVKIDQGLPPLVPAPNHADRHDRYFLVAFGYQGPGNKANDSHTFVTLVHVLPNGTRKEKHISWLPKNFGEDPNLNIFDGGILAIPFAKLNSAPPVIGKNYTLNETLDFARQGHRDVAMFGPYEIVKDLHDKYLTQISDLESGRINYKPDDRLTRKDRTALNCFHASGELGGTLMPLGGILGTGLKNWGIAGTQSVLEHLKLNWPAEFITPVDSKFYNEFFFSPPSTPDSEKVKGLGRQRHNRHH